MSDTTPPAGTTVLSTEPPVITPPSSPMWSKAWLLGMGERVITTFAFTFGAALIADGFVPGVSTGAGIHWLSDIAIAGTASGFSLLKAIATPGFTAGK